MKRLWKRFNDWMKQPVGSRRQAQPMWPGPRHMAGRYLHEASCGATGERSTYIRDHVTCIPCLNRIYDGQEIYDRMQSDRRAE